MFQISYDQAKNRITVKVQSITMEEVETYIQEFNKVLTQVKPGFTGLTDLSEGKLFTQEVAVALGPLGELSVQKGLSKWAYFTGSAVSKMQMKRMFGDIVLSFEKLEDAEAYLN
ncbi:hypothetical protein [Paenibacillus planticolens]|uniref:STAS/SEC14 domain-containing protein n=1 Tax=Paenibacillus planticolens TaxID=2654976 RepID=A0ABX1ZKI0_9BACL|nr:hypothetical protein [Paenibacillus planticolens]NOV00602.1 hypothetical protein [Paenibacillus planticolens]